MGWLRASARAQLTKLAVRSPPVNLLNTPRSRLHCLAPPDLARGVAQCTEAGVALEAKHSALKEESAALNDTLRDTRGQHAALEKKHSALSTDHTKLADDLTKLADDHSALQNKVG